MKSKFIPLILILIFIITFVIFYKGLKNPNIYIFGKDYLDRPVEGGTIKEYLNEYRQT